MPAGEKVLGGAKKAGGDAPLAQEADILHAAWVSGLADTGKQMADAYGLGAKEPAARSRSGAFSKMRADYYGIARSRLMDAMQSVMNQRSKLSGNPMPVQINFPGFTGGTDPTVTKIKGGQWVADGERFAAEAQLDRNALARTLTALAGAGSDPSKGQQFFSSGKVEIDPRVYFIDRKSTR